MKEGMYVTWEKGDHEGLQRALAGSAGLGRQAEPVRRSQASDVFNNIAPNNVSIRDGFTRYDYESWRLDEARPMRSKDQILAAMRAYEEHGLVYNVINLMSDFATKGIDIVHQNERVEKWWKEWWRQVRGPIVSERFCNYLTRTGVVLSQRQTAKISVKVQQEMQRATAAKPDFDAQDDYDAVTEKRTIPWHYVFLNPLTINVLAEDVACFVGQDWFQFALVIPRVIANRIKNPRAGEAPVMSAIPSDIRNMIVGGKLTIPLDPKKVSAYYYKRDDWRVWAMPMINPILKDLNILEKMKLADMAALDGAVSCIRVWKLGNIEARILPTETAIARLADILQNNVGGGVMDLVWGPELELVETNTGIHKFLGDQKYAPHLRAVYQGLGIPSAIGGAGEKSGGFNTDFFSLKTLTDRLEYVRSVVRQFWENEFKIVQKAMGFRFPAKLVFDHMDLGDPAAQKQLWLRLAEEDIISWETTVRRFGEDPDLEEIRLRREFRKRKSGQLPPKAGPYHDPQQDFGLKKIFAQTGSVTPSEVGLTLEDPEPGEETPAEHNAKLAPKPVTDSRKGKPGQGRPAGKRDEGKRKTKVVKPRTSAASEDFLKTLAWAENAQGKVQGVLGPAYLKAVSKSNFRELTDEQARNFEDYKVRVLFQLQPSAELNDANIKKAAVGSLDVPSIPLELLKKAIAGHVETTGKEPTVDVLRRFQAGAYALWHAA